MEESASPREKAELPFGPAYGAEPLPGYAPGTRPTIMVVDDTPSNLRLLEALLERSGYRAICQPGGAEALSAAALEAPDLILLDINMPHMDGFAVCEALKADRALADVPVIFISAISEVEGKIRAFSVGGVDYIPKPFQIEEVLARVRTHLKLRGLQRELEGYNRRLEELVADKAGQIINAQLAMVVALAKLVEYRDDDTGQHIERTQEYCRLLALELAKDARFRAEIDEGFIEMIYRVAPLHDIGKVGIPDNILQKPGKLDRAEFDVMKFHTLIGARTLQAARLNSAENAYLDMGIVITRSHHERWDGTGYPDSLIGRYIPLPARIMAVADVYDALRSRRPYKDAFPHDEAAAIIGSESGRYFDPAVVETFQLVAPEFARIDASMGGA